MAVPELLGLAVSLYEVAQDPLNTLVTALVILLSGFIIARLLDTVLQHLFSRFAFDAVLSRTLGRRRRYARSTRRLLRYVMYAATVYLAFLRLGIANYLLAALMLVFLLIILVSVFLAGAELLPNIIAFRNLRRTYKIGDRIEISSPQGTVEGKIVTMRSEFQVDRDGEILFFPARTLEASRIKKLS